LELAGGILNGALTLPANGLTSAGNQLAAAGGSVGIGTATPGAPLEVAGSVKISGAGSGLTFPDGSTQTTAGNPAGALGVNRQQVALLKWFPAYQASGAFTVGANPTGVAFDGANIWIANSGSNTVTKLLAATGMAVGTYTVGSNPTGVAFDGANIWVANSASDTVTKLLAASGAVVGTYAVGIVPIGIAFDGANIWVTNSGSNTVTKLLAATGELVGTYSVGTDPWEIAFDGTSIWVANSGEDTGNTVTKLLASTGALVGTYTVGTGPGGVVFDGANVWVGNYTDGTVTKLRAATGEVLGTYPAGGSPAYIAFDGASVWVAILSANFVNKLSAATGTLEGTYLVGSGYLPWGIAFDGANIWVTNNGRQHCQQAVARYGGIMKRYLAFSSLAAGLWAALPRLVLFSGAAKDARITFALYAEQTGGTPLWTETQNVQTGPGGHYTVLLGSTKPEGLPAGLFASEQARWVGVTVEGQSEQPRVLLVSAPYALKAGDAETLGGTATFGLHAGGANHGCRRRSEGGTGAGSPYNLAYSMRASPNFRLRRHPPRIRNQPTPGRSTIA
jgi:hypothetical protein